MGLSCSECGFKSENGAFFRLEKTSRRGSGWFCMGCKPVRGKLGFATLGFYGVLAFVAALITAAEPSLAQFAYILALLSGLVTLTPLTVAVHELGHTIAAVAVGRRIYQINIGRGAPLATMHLGQALVVIGKDMGAGFVACLPVGRNDRWRQAIFILAGAAANIAAGVLLIALADHISAVKSNIWAGEAECILWGWALSNLVAGIASLVPSRVTINWGIVPSDGSLFLSLFKRQLEAPDWQVYHEDYKGWMLIQTKRWSEAEAHYRANLAAHPEHPSFLANLLHVLALAKGPPAAMACVLEHEPFLRRTEQPTNALAPIWASTWGNAAWAILRSPGGDMALADEFSLRAAGADTTSPYPRAVRSAVLVRSGQREEGFDAILASLKDMLVTSDKLEFCDFIVAEGLENADLTRADFEAYAAHLRTLA
jgi:hypothetical protein